MKLDVGKFRIELMPVTQLCGSNFRIKSTVVNSLYKFFSKYKYSENEKNRISDILIDDEMVGRNYFDTVYIRNLDDILVEMKITKSSLITQWINEKMGEFEYVTNLEKIADLLDDIYAQINKELRDEEIGVHIDYESQDMLEILTKSHSDLCRENEGLNEDNQCQFLISYINLLTELQKKSPHKQMIIIDNIDHILSRKEYETVMSIIDERVKKYDMWFVVTTSIDGYAYIDNVNFTGINVINDEVFTMPEYEHMRDFIVKNYPYNYVPERCQLLEDLKMIIQKIGDSSSDIKIKKSIYLKLINKSMGINMSRDKANSLEVAFLLE